MRDDESVRELRAMNAKFIENFVTNDVRCHDQITHKDFVCITAKGRREDKGVYLKRWATGFDPEVITYWDYRDESISVFGSTALVRSINKHTVVKDGVESTGMTAYTDIYIRENGEWTCIQAQLTPVAPENYPDDATIVKAYVKGKPQQG